MLNSAILTIPAGRLQGPGPLNERFGLVFGGHATLVMLARDAGTDVTRLASLVPALCSSKPDMPLSAAASPARQRFRLYDAVIQVLFSVPRSQPGGLVLDDQHRMHLDPLHLLRYVAQFVRLAPLVLAGSCRDLEFGPSRRHSGLLRSSFSLLQRGAENEPNATRGLNQAERVGYLAEAAGQDRPQSIARHRGRAERQLSMSVRSSPMG